MQTLPNPADLVLVVFMPTPQDMEILIGPEILALFGMLGDDQS